MTRVAFLDLADNTGIAHDARLGGMTPEMASLFIEPEDPKDPADALYKLASSLRVLITTQKIEVLAYERVMGARAQIKSSYTKDERIALAHMREAIVMLVAREYGLPCYDPPVHTIRKNFCGQVYGKEKGSIKAVVIARCRQLGWKPSDDNQADSAAGWWYVKAMLDPKFGQDSSPLMVAAR